MSNDNKQVDEVKLDQINENANKPSRLKGFAVAMGFTAMTVAPVAGAARLGYGDYIKDISRADYNVETDYKQDKISQFYERISFNPETGELTPLAESVVMQQSKLATDIRDKVGVGRDYDYMSGTYTYNRNVGTMLGAASEQLLGDSHMSDYGDTLDKIGRHVDGIKTIDSEHEVTYQDPSLNFGAVGRMNRMKMNYADAPGHEQAKTHLYKSEFGEKTAREILGDKYFDEPDGSDIASAKDDAGLEF